MMGRSRDDGQAMGLLIIAVCLVMTMAVGLASLSVGLVQRSRAQTAADAAAIAGALGGVGQATRAAARNGATVAAFTLVTDGDANTATVTVELGGKRATARASDTP
jgi:hypothetical protein